MEETTARYIAKHAAQRSKVFEQFRVRFRVPDDGDIEQLYEQSIDTSLRDALIGLFDEILLHGAVGFVQTLAWYEEGRDLSEMYRALERGPRKNSAGERWEAAEANRKLRDRAAQTAAKADLHVAEQSEDSKRALLEALGAERALARSDEISRILRPWAEYDINEIASSKEGALEAVKNMGQQNVRAIESTTSLLQAHEQAVLGSDPPLLPPASLHIPPKPAGVFAGYPRRCPLDSW